MEVDDDELEEDSSDPASILQQCCMFCIKNGFVKCEKTGAQGTCAKWGGGVSRRVSPEHRVNKRRLVCASLKFWCFYMLTLNTYRAQVTQEVGARSVSADAADTDESSGCVYLHPNRYMLWRLTFHSAKPVKKAQVTPMS